MESYCALIFIFVGFYEAFPILKKIKKSLLMSETLSGTILAKK